MAGTLSAKQIKFIKSLSQKKIRDEYSLFVVEGEKLVNEALASDYNVREVYRISEIGENSMSRISSLSSPSPALAVIEKKDWSSFSLSSTLDSSLNRSDFLCLGLDGISDPGNMGTIIRTADWFGLDYIFANEGSVDIYNPKCIQATMGAIFRKKIIYTNLGEVADAFAMRKLPVWGTLLNGDNIYSKIDKAPKRGLIVMGNESNGISLELRARITDKILIPTYPQDAVSSESLNVATATAIVCALFRKTL